MSTPKSTAAPALATFEFPAVDDDALEKFKAARFPRVVLRLQTCAGPCVFVMPSPTQIRKFLAEKADTKTAPDAPDRFVKGCVISPGLDEFERVCEVYAGIPLGCFEHIAEGCGLSGVTKSG